mgnify:CR=1 FL=1
MRGQLQAKRRGLFERNIQLCKKTTKELFEMKGFNSRLLEYLAIRLIEHGNE